MENEGNGTMKNFGGVTVTVKRLEVGGVLGVGGGVIKESLQKYLEMGWGDVSLGTWVADLEKWVAGYELSICRVGLPMTRELALNPGIHKANCDHDNH